MTNPVLVMINQPTVSSPEVSEPFTIVPADGAAINAMDLGITRGDGIFESVGIHNGKVHAVEAHLTRFANSARLLDLPAPNADAYRLAVEKGIELLGDVPDAYAKYVLTRGIEAQPDSAPTGYAFIDVNPDFSAARTTGISVVTLSRGYELNIMTTAPWLLQGSKYLSYAINRSVLREAARRDADDVLFTTTDGYILEGPTASIVLKIGDTFVTPSPDYGVLHGTAQQGFFDYCAEHGLATEYRTVTVAELADADGMWLTNSQRLAAPIRELDGVALAIDDAFTASVNDYLLNRQQ